MIFAGAVEFSFTPQEVALILGILAAVAFGACCVGGLIAWAISRRRRSFWLGFAAIPAGAIAAVFVGLPDFSLPAALLASVAVGVYDRRRSSVPHA